MNELSNKMIINEDTGEVEGYLTKKEYQILDKMRSSTNMLNINVSKSDKSFHIFVDEVFGRFYHNYYEKTLTKKHLFRFIYLCTFMNYKNYIEFGKAKECNKLVNKKQCQEILGLANRQFYETINYFLNNKMIEIDDNNYIKINKQFCNRGKVINKNRMVARMFDKSIREIYENSNIKEHEKIGLLLKLIPFINVESNIICHNPKETNLELIKPMKQKEILNILEISKPTYSKLLNIKIMNGTESAIIKVSNAFLKNFYVLNPRFIFNGYGIDDMKILNETLKLFQVGKR